VKDNPLVSKKAQNKGRRVAFMGNMLVFVRPSQQRNKPIINKELRVNPNELCSCGSGKRTKKCCPAGKKKKWWRK